MADDPQDAESELDTDDLDTDEQVDEEPVDDTDATTSKDTGDTKDTKGAGGSKASKGSKGSEEPTAPVVRKKVVSKRVTPKGGARPATAKAGAAKAGAANRSTKRKADDDEEISFSSGRYTPPSSSSAQLPSPWWVPALMFGLLIVGALVIMLNYMELFGSAENYRLIIGLVLILGGIITATQYR